MNPLSETILLAELKHRRDPGTFARVYDAYVKQIYRFVYFKVRSHEEAEDLTADVFLKAWNYLQDHASELTSIRGLLYRIARTKIIDWYRSRARRPQIISTEFAESIEEGLHDRNAWVEQTERSLEHQTVLSAISRLKHDYQELVMLRYIENLSIKEIAEITGKAALTVRVTLHRAVRKLEEFLTPKIPKK